MGYLTLTAYHRDRIFAKENPFEPGPQNTPLLAVSLMFPRNRDRTPGLFSTLAHLRIRLRRGDFMIDEKKSTELKVLERRTDSKHPYSINLAAYEKATLIGNWSYEGKTAQMTIKIVEIKPEKITIAFNAPEKIKILRGSILPPRNR